MMTSNRPLEDWGKLIGDVPSATAILDRFLHHATIIAITGKSYRLRNQNTRPTDEPTTIQNQPTCRPAPLRKRRETQPTDPTRRSGVDLPIVTRLTIIQHHHPAGPTCR